MIARIKGAGIHATGRVSGAGQGDAGGDTNRPPTMRGDSPSIYRGARGLDPELIKEIERQFGFDLPAHRFEVAAVDVLAVGGVLHIQ